MKKVLVLLLCLSSLLACNNADNKKDDTVAQSTGDAHHHNETLTLTLNNGAKWNSDESTNKNLRALDAIVNRWNEKNNKVIADYKIAGNEMQTGLDQMISECRMKGPDHDALHLWLEPLMKNIRDMKNTNDEKEASSLFYEINKRINKYFQYFE